MVLPNAHLQRPAFRERFVSFLATWMQQSMQSTVTVYLLSSDAVNGRHWTLFIANFLTRGVLGLIEVEL